MRWLLDLIDRAIDAALFLGRVGLVLFALWAAVTVLFGDAWVLDRLFYAGCLAYVAWLWWTEGR